MDLDFMTTARRVVPSPVRQRLRALQQDYVLQRGITRLRTVVERKEIPDTKLLGAIERGWNNEGWAARPHYLQTLLSIAGRTKGPLLDCGSGLSTILLGLLAQLQGREVWSLEHNEDWAKRVTRLLSRFGLTRVRLCVAPLREYGEFHWYDPPLAEMPKNFGFASVDGPPGTTSGGRYGFMPVMAAMLGSDCSILVDDVHRIGEREMVDRWEHEFELFQRPSDDETFAILCTE